jgi:hypothetical protein
VKAAGKKSQHAVAAADRATKRNNAGPSTSSSSTNAVDWFLDDEGPLF